MEPKEPTDPMLSALLREQMLSTEPEDRQDSQELRAVLEEVIPQPAADPPSGPAGARNRHPGKDSARDPNRVPGTDRLLSW